MVEKAAPHPAQRVRVINIGPSKPEEEAKEASPSTAPASAGAASLPTNVELNSALTARLKEKMNEAFAGRNTSPPEVEIYLSPMNLDEFSNYYEGRGYKIQRTSVPASQIVAPLLEEKPELRGKISLGNYAGVTINQIIVEGENISAADKYIDPETYEVIYKTFVTVTKIK